MRGRRAWVAVCVVAACAGRSSAPGPGATAPAVEPVSIGPAPDAGPPPVTLRCTAGAPRGEFNRYDRAATLETDDGAFTDACDAHGDLRSYQCEVEDLVCPGGRGRDQDRHEIAPCYEQTGRVEATTVDCDGRCRAGACAVRCPQAGDRLTYLRLDAGGDPVFASDADPRRIACALAFDQPRDTFDCASAPRVGDVLVVEGLGMSTTTCTGGTWGSISDARCTYSGCRYVAD